MTTVETTPKKQEKRIESSSKKTNSTRGAKDKLKKIKVPHKPGTFSLGMSLVFDTILRHIGLACGTLHAWYMRQTDKAREDRPIGFTISYMENHFLHKPGYFTMGFLDPQLISKQCITQDASYVEKYIARRLLTHRDKDYILVPYN